MNVSNSIKQPLVSIVNDKLCGTHNVQYSVCSGQTSLQIGETSSVLGNLKALIYR